MWKALSAEKDEVTRAVAENDKTVRIHHHIHHMLLLQYLLPYGDCMIMPRVLLAT